VARRAEVCPGNIFRYQISMGSGFARCLSYRLQWVEADRGEELEQLRATHSGARTRECAMQQAIAARETDLGKIRAALSAAQSQERELRDDELARAEEQGIEAVAAAEAMRAEIASARIALTRNQRKCRSIAIGDWKIAQRSRRGQAARPPVTRDRRRGAEGRNFPSYAASSMLPARSEGGSRLAAKRCRHAARAPRNPGWLAFVSRRLGLRARVPSPLAG
jgi:hypothetical protein